MVAVGDPYSTISPVAPGGTLEIRPSGFYAVIHNFYYSGSVDIYFSDGSNTIKIAYDTEEDSLQGYWEVSFNHFYRMVNPTSNTLNYGYSGIVTKVP